MESTSGQPVTLTRTPTVGITSSPQKEEIHSTPKCNHSAVLARYPSYLLRKSPISEKTKLEDLNSSPNAWLHAFLPYDIIFSIFTQLSRRDLARAAAVCRYWRKVSKDPYFGWAVVREVLLKYKASSTPTKKGSNLLGALEPADLIVRMA